VTRHPTAEWLAQQILEAFPWNPAPPYLVRDNDRAYGQAFTRRLRTMGIRDRPISPRSPWQNAYVERLIGTLRRECLDHVLIYGERHLRRVLTLYSLYYNETRTHSGRHDREGDDQMTPEERNLIIDLFDRLVTLEDAQRDPDAERLISDGLRQAPNAPYALVQTVLVQDEALKRADERIRELEAGSATETTARDTSFLGGMRDNSDG
jgi:hypothetical protein